MQADSSLADTPGLVQGKVKGKNLSWIVEKASTHTHSVEGLGAACLPAALGLRAALDFELSGCFFLEAHLIISACYPISGRFPVSLPLACICSWGTSEARASQAEDPHSLPHTRGSLGRGGVQAPFTPFTVPKLLIRWVTHSHHRTRVLMQGDLCSTRLLLTPDFPPSFRCCVTGASGWNYSTPAKVYFKSLSFNI